MYYNGEDSFYFFIGGIMKKKPIIGITTSLIIDKGKTFAGYKRVYVNKDYIDSIIQAGGIPLMIPFNENKDIIISQAQLIDGLLITGGHDVFPYNYGQEPHPKLGECFPERDEYEYLLLEEAKKRNIPVLGICRGHQIINTFEGGDLYQDMSLIEGEVLRHWQVDNPTQKTHKIKIEKDSMLSTICPEEIMVNSFHHQAIKNVAEGYKVIARASDGVVEAIENEKYRFLLGIQWHPEMLHAVCDDAKELFKQFVDECKDL